MGLEELDELRVKFNRFTVSLATSREGAATSRNRIKFSQFVFDVVQDKSHPIRNTHVKAVLEMCKEVFDAADYNSTGICHPDDLLDELAELYPSEKRTSPIERSRSNEILFHQFVEMLSGEAGGTSGKDKDEEGEKAEDTPATVELVNQFQSNVKALKEKNDGLMQELTLRSRQLLDARRKLQVFEAMSSQMERLSQVEAIEKELILEKKQTLSLLRASEHETASLKEANENLRRELAKQRAGGTVAQASKLETEAVIALRKDAEMLRADNTRLSAELEKSKIVNDEVEKEVKSANSEIQALRVDLEQARGDVRVLEAEWRTKLEMKLAELQECKAELKELQLDFRKVQIPTSTLVPDATKESAMRKEIEVLKQKVAQLEEDVEERDRLNQENRQVFTKIDAEIKRLVSTGVSQQVTVTGGTMLTREHEEALTMAADTEKQLRTDLQRLRLENKSLVKKVEQSQAGKLLSALQQEFEPLKRSNERLQIEKSKLLSQSRLESMHKLDADTLWSGMKT